MPRLAPILGAMTVGTAILLLPAAWALRGRGAKTMDRITTLDDAVSACRRSGLSGWDLVTYAQRLVYHKFTHYSCRNLWDTPAGAFRRGMGYCTQYNLALKEILDRLGFDVWPVFSLRVSVDREPDWTMGHTWLRVRVDGETRDVCAGDVDNLPGKVSFRPLAPEWSGDGLVLFLTHLGMVGFCGFVEWRALLGGRPLPKWMLVER